MKVINLNKRQQVFAETHFGLTLDFIKDRGLSYRQFHDVIRVGYLVAVKLYHEGGLFHQKESFEKFAQRYMQAALCQVSDGLVNDNGNSYALVIGRLLSDGRKREGYALRTIQESVQRRLRRIPSQYQLSHTYTVVSGYQPVAVGEVM